MTDENKTPEEAVKTTDTAKDTAPEAKAGDSAPAKDAAKTDAPKAEETKAAAPAVKRGRGAPKEQSNENPLSDKPLQRRGGGRGGKGGKGGRGDKANKEFQEILLEVRRVTRVTTGGRQLAFRAIIVIGNGKGKIGLGVAKGNDVSIAVRKATHEAYKNVVQAPVTEELTVPYGITHKYKSAIVKLMPATQGTGLKAGSSVRTVLELAGYNNILSKIIGTNNKLNNAICAIQALSMYKVGKTPPKQGDEKKGKKNDKPSDAKAEKGGDKKVEKKDDKKTQKKEDKKETVEA